MAGGVRGHRDRHLDRLVAANAQVRAREEGLAQRSEEPPGQLRHRPAADAVAGPHRRQVSLDGAERLPPRPGEGGLGVVPRAQVGAPEGQQGRVPLAPLAGRRLERDHGIVPPVHRGHDNAGGAKVDAEAHAPSVAGFLSVRRRDPPAGRPARAAEPDPSPSRARIAREAGARPPVGQVAPPAECPWVRRRWTPRPGAGRRRTTGAPGWR